MASSIGRRKHRQRQRPVSPYTTNFQSQSLPNTTISSSVSPHLGDFSKIFAFLDPQRGSTAQPAQEPLPVSEPDFITQGNPSSPRLLYISESVFRDIMGPRGNGEKARLVTKRRPENSAQVHYTNSPIPFVFDSTSDDYDSDVPCLGDFDPVDPSLDVSGGADLSDITTPPTSPRSQTATPFAADRLFEKTTAGRARAISGQPLSSRIVNDYRAHDTELEQTHPELVKEGLHIFIDASNHIVAFYDLLKQQLGIPKHKNLPPCISMSAVHEVLARERPVVKQCIAGSKNPKHKKRSKYFDDAEALGYRTMVRNRVTLPRDGKSQKKVYYDDDSDDMFGSYQAEEGVDEMIQTQMHYSIMDSEPGVMVLVTGDGNSNEDGFSEGFPADVKRALRAGWIVEVYAFKNSCAGIWTSPEFVANETWVGRYSVHYLDAYAQALCNPDYKTQLDNLAFKYASRLGARSAQCTSKRKVYCAPLEKEVRNESTSTTTTAEKLSAAPGAILEGNWRTPSPLKKMRTTLSDYHPAEFGSSGSSSSYQQKPKNSSTSSTFDLFGTATVATAKALLAEASLKSGSGFTGGVLGSFQKSYSPPGISF